MTYLEMLSYIHTLKRSGAASGLERMQVLMERLGNPQWRLKFIHIAGTNGKGSCAAMTAGALRAAGYHTGLTISPYVIDFRERFQIDGRWIEEEAFLRLAERICREVKTLEAEGILITEFEFNTALAFLWFEESRCDIVVLETGLGGLLDATNVIPCPEVSVIMAISLDHTAILGKTVEEIAVQKAGIIKGGTVVLYPVQEPEVVAVIMEKCALTGAKLLFPSVSGVEIRSADRTGSDFVWDGKEYRVGLAGRHQVYNAITVLETLRAISEHFPVSLRDARQGLANVRFPARLETLQENPLVLLDGAHNPHGVAALAQVLSETIPQRPKIGVIGMMADKDWQHAVQALAACFDGVVAVPVQSPRSASAEEIAAAARKTCTDVRVASGAEAAVEIACRMAGKKGAVCIAGSLYLAAEVRAIFRDGGAI